MLCANKWFFRILLTLILIYAFVSKGNFIRAEDEFRQAVDSALLKNTTIDPVLDKAFRPGKNIIYCATFQLAWNLLQDSLIKEPLLLDNNPREASLLNQQLFTKKFLDPASYYAALGRLTPDFLTRINRALKKKFGKNAPPPVREPISQEAFLAYAYLFKNLKFWKAFQELAPLSFNYQQVSTKVAAFGISRATPRGPTAALTKQIKVLDYQGNDNFIIKLISQEPNEEIILARVKPETTLLKTFQKVNQRIETTNYYETSLNEGEILKIPKIGFYIKHSYSQLENRQLRNKGWQGWTITKAMQWTRFQLNQKGATLKSEARIIATKCFMPLKKREFIFNKPFLIYLKEKSAPYPYLALWIANPEVLIKVK